MQKRSFFSWRCPFQRKLLFFRTIESAKRAFAASAGYKNFSETKNKTAEKITGQCFPVKSKVTCKNLAYLDEEKKFGLKGHLRGCCTKPFNCNQYYSESDTEFVYQAGCQRLAKTLFYTPQQTTKLLHLF